MGVMEVNGIPYVPLVSEAAAITAIFVIDPLIMLYESCTEEQNNEAPPLKDRVKQQLNDRLSYLGKSMIRTACFTATIFTGTYVVFTKA